MRRLPLLLLVIVSLFASAQTGTSFTNAPIRAPQPPIEMAHDTHVHQLLANSSVRVYRIDLAAGAETALDRHDHDFLVLSLGSNEFELAGPGNAYPMSMRDSEVEVMKGHWPHRIVNKSKNSLHLIEIESTAEISPERAVCGLAAQSCTGAKFAKDDTTNYVESTLFITPSMRLAKVEIQPTAGTPEHGHTSSHLMIALNDQQLTNTIVAGTTSAIDVHAGDPTWVGGDIVHRLINRGQQSARFLTIEWK
jgi:quercetin dioxygenase-like cupin family protein